MQVFALLKRIRPSVALSALLLLTGCLYLPPIVEGLPSGGSWVGIPVQAWVSEGEIRAEAITACFAPDCAPRVGVGVFRATGDEARTIQAVLRDPERLVRFIEQRGRRGASAKRPLPRTVASVTPLGDGKLSGFAARLMREDGTRAAHIVAIGAETAGGLRLVIAAGESAEGVRMAAQQASNLR